MKLERMSRWGLWGSEENGKMRVVGIFVLMQTRTFKVVNFIGTGSECFFSIYFFQIAPFVHRNQLEMHPLPPSWNQQCQLARLWKRLQPSTLTPARQTGLHQGRTDAGCRLFTVTMPWHVAGLVCDTFCSVSQLTVMRPARFDYYKIAIDGKKKPEAE